MSIRRAWVLLSTLVCLFLALSGNAPISDAFQIGQLKSLQCGRSYHRSSTRLLDQQSSEGVPSRLSAASQERRAEEKRRQERTRDVVIGKTSAVGGVSDLPLDISATEQQYLQQASKIEQQVHLYTSQGMQALQLLKLEEADKAFTHVFTKLKPNAYIWQAGIVKYYLGEYKAAGKIFAQCADIYETKFNQPATEERIWRHAAALKIMTSELSKPERKRLTNSGMFDSIQSETASDDHDSASITSDTMAEKIKDFSKNYTSPIDELVDPIPPKDYDDELYKMETRKVLKTVRDLFEASVSCDLTTLILSRAKLRSIGGPVTKETAVDRKFWKLHSWFYLGLHYDALGDVDESKECMKMAIQQCPNGASSDIVHILPMLHMSRRDWFDDDEMDEDFRENAIGNRKASTTKVQSSQTSSSRSSRGGFATEPIKVERPQYKDVTKPDPLLLESIRSGVAKLRYLELQEALRIRGIRAVGSKEELQRRLFSSLLSDAGLSS